MTLALLALAVLAPSDVLDVGPNGAYLNIQSAVDAAAEGDVLRIEPGTYASFSVHAKSLSLVPASATFTVEGVVRVQGLALGQTFLMQGARLEHAYSNRTEERLILGFNEGSVRLEDVRAERVTTPQFPPAATILRAARVVSCDDVCLVDCTFEPVVQSGTGFWGGTVYGTGGVAFIDSTVAMYHCDVTADGTSFDPAIHCSDNSELVGMGLSVRGSWGEDSGPGSTWNPGVCVGFAHGGSPGVFVDASSSMTRVNCSIAGGTSGRDYCTGSSYSAAPPFDGPGTLIEVAGRSLGLTAPSVAVDGSVASVTVSGGITDQTILVMGPTAGRRSAPALVGDLLLGGPAGSVQRLVLGTGHQLTGQVQLPSLAPFGIDALHLQAAHVRPDPSAPGGTRILLGPPRVVTILDAAW